MNSLDESLGPHSPIGLSIDGRHKPIHRSLFHISDIKTPIPFANTFKVPLYSNSVSAGFPSPADDYIQSKLDLNEHIIHHPAATFFVRASGDSMKDAGIQSGDMLVVDRSLEPLHGKIVIAAINGELTVKRLCRQSGRVRLLPANTKYQPIDITEEQDLVIWGVVTHVIHETN
ncbi:MAG: translesion error-prone DNA polymerase V autoproteolytic subunit [Legionella sp.]|nr:translesion error-prone DNA polymerase V autoproteolytic subunit [Legionella sp.]